ncbi:MAG: ABC transporter ATP-binding protein [Caldilineaceae bacterium]
MLLGLTERSGGQVQVLGFDPARPAAASEGAGYLVPDQIGFYDELSARENLAYIARLNAFRGAEAAPAHRQPAGARGLSDVVNKMVGAFSRGMRQRLSVVEVLLKEPQVIIMDEPTLGLDPEAARQFLAMIREMKQEGITIMLSSVPCCIKCRLCATVGLFQKGRMVLEGPVSELAQKVLGGGYQLHLEVNGQADPIEQALRKLTDVTEVMHTGNRFTLKARRDLRADAARAAIQAGGNLLALDVDAPSLDEIYTQYFQEVEHVHA